MDNKDAHEQSFAVVPEVISDCICASFGGAAELTQRNRGPISRVVPFHTIRGIFRAWLGFSETWERQTKTEFTFKELSLTVHLGNVGENFKPQVIRAEWPGIRKWNGTELGFQSHGAGHPHWQFDLCETLRRAPAKDYRPDDETVEEFGVDEQQSDDVIRLVHSTTLERMHLASAASWWLPEEDVHMNHPSDVHELTRWLLSCIKYLRQEIAHCEVKLVK